MNPLNRLRLRRQAVDVNGTQERRLRELEQRIGHIESELWALQDSVHRQFVRQDERIGEVIARTRPQELAQTLSREARRRGV